MEPTVQLQLESRPESVALARAMLAGISEQLQFGPELLADLKTAVSEACNNVVMHAYGARPGPMEINLFARPESVEVNVIDHGKGIDEGMAAEDHHGVGFAVIDALASESRLEAVPGGGTATRIVFARPPAGAGSAELTGSPDGVRPPLEMSGDVVLSVAPVEVLAGILGRVAGCVAAEAHFSIDRYSDLYLVTDGIAAHAKDHAQGASITASLAAQPRQVELTVGPFIAGTASELRSQGSGGASQLLALLVDDVEVEAADDDAEALRLMLVDRRRDDPA